MIFHENRLLADDSHDISYLIFFLKLAKISQNVSPAAVVIGALRVKEKHCLWIACEKILVELSPNIFHLFTQQIYREY